jgi:hypothetical protein
MSNTRMPTMTSVVMTGLRTKISETEVIGRRTRVCVQSLALQAGVDRPHLGAVDEARLTVGDDVLAAPSPSRSPPRRSPYV